MRSNRHRDTGPELAVRSLLHARGLRYRVDHPMKVDDVRIRPDVVFPRKRVAVFIDGCFWHCCPEHGSLPATNTSYWLPKLRANVERDTLHSTLLGQDGWQVLRFWEHEDPEEVAATVERAVSES
jgi:DNA mismatch endonuclease (patch repair protein)